jgi:hypothetical protein
VQAIIFRTKGDVMNARKAACSGRKHIGMWMCCATLICVGLPGVAGAQSDDATESWRQLRIADAADWSFIGPAWFDLDSDAALRTYLDRLHVPVEKSRYEAGPGVIAPPAVPFNIGVKPWHAISDAYEGQRNTNVDLMQAFDTAKAYGDFEAQFKFRWGSSGHSGAGFIFRATDAGHYYMAHFPSIGQATRTSHFWAVISKVDANGWTEVLKMQMLHGVSTEPQVWHQVRLLVQGNEFRLWVDGRPMAVVTDDDYAGPGHIGLHAWSYHRESSTFKDVRIRGKAARDPQWDSTIKPVKNWFLPYPAKGSEQSCTGITRAPNGDLLMALSPGGLVRSKDDGRTWTLLTSFDQGWLGGWLHKTRDGRLITLRAVGSGATVMAESKDNGKTWPGWDKIRQVDRPAFSPPAKQPDLTLGDPWVQSCVELRDGTMLMFQIGQTPGMKALAEAHSIWDWGTHAAGAWSIRSTDGGYTWSAPIPLNGPPASGQKWDLCEAISTVQTKDGKVLALVRSIHSPLMWEVWSDDGGATWGPAMPGPFPCWAATALTTESGVLLVAGRFPGAPGLYVSHDSGMTWKAYAIDTGGMRAMGKMYEVKPNVILYVYGDSYHSEMRAQFIQITDDGAQPARAMLMGRHDKD